MGASVLFPGNTSVDDGADGAAISQLTTSSATLVRLPTQATLLPRIDRGRR